MYTMSKIYIAAVSGGYYSMYYIVALQIKFLGHVFAKLPRQGLLSIAEKISVTTKTSRPPLPLVARTFENAQNLSVTL